MRFTSQKLIGLNGVREHIMQMRDIAAQLKSLEVDMFESFLVHYILNTLPPQYTPFKICYNTHKDKWSINELMTMCVQEERKLSIEVGESVHMATQEKNKDQVKEKGKAKLPPHCEIKKESKCFFCKKKGHIKKDCPKFKTWLEKKGNQLSYVCYESNIVDVYHNTWWIDSGSTIHVTNSLQDLENLKKPVESECYIYSGNHMGSRVKAIRTCRLVLNTGFVLVLKKTFYISNFSRNLISVSRLVPYGYSFNFGDDVTLFYNTHLVRNGTLSNGLYHINLQSDLLCTLYVDGIAGIKRCVMNEDSSVLWHRRLGHISIERIKNTRIVESRNAKFLEDNLISRSDKGLRIKSKDHSESQPSTSSNGLIVVVHNTPIVKTRVEQPIQTVPQVDDHEPVDSVVLHILRNIEQPVDQQAPPENVDATLRRSTRIKRSSIHSDYMVYLQESMFDIGAENDPETFSQAMKK
ncbi:UNVERIFIED_CONTAM: hypothetical protein Sradi_1509100 [Sesamum radiatum]|uniref:CCHC-type domain-containing protein n=1 Tax=Sesamum radiatum TaxID=300843 RepID=A0AAW2U869_SESRA